MHSVIFKDKIFFIAVLLVAEIFCPAWAQQPSSQAYFSSGEHTTNADENIRTFTLKVHQPDNKLTNQGKPGSSNHIVASNAELPIFCGNFLQPDTGEITKDNHCSAMYRERAVVTLQAVADTANGYQFEGWGGACNGVGSCVVAMTINQSVIATFSRTKKTMFSLKMDKIGKGTVNTNVAAHCYSRSDNCATPVQRGSWVTLTATPDAGYHFTGWGGACAGSHTCTVHIQGDQAVMATFAENAEQPSCVARDFSLAEEGILGAYIAYYGRPPDAAGLAWWSDEMHRKGGNIQTIISAFGQGREYTDRFGSMSNRELLNNLYQQLYGRNADPEGLDWYTEQLATRQSTLATIAIEIHDGAQGSDATQLENRKKVARHYVTLAEKNRFLDLTADDLASLLARVNAGTANTNAICEELSDKIR